MMDTSKLKTAQDWIEKLANGLNPLTSEPVKEDDIINNVHISRCLFYVSEILVEMGSKESTLTRTRKRAFCMTATEAEQIIILASSGIAQFVRTVNEHIPSDMRSLPASQVIKWLRSNGYLYEVSFDGKHKTNLPTEKGNEIGITLSVAQNTEGQEYKRVMYDISAQRFLLSNIESIAYSR